MNEEDYKKVVELIKAKIAEIRTLGIKAETPWKHVRGAVGSYRIKRIAKWEHQAEKELTKVEEKMKNHLVSAVQKSEKQILLYITEGMAYLYWVLQEEALFEKVHFKHLDQLADAFKKQYGKRLDKLGEKNKADVMKAWDELMAGWKHELKVKRANINAAVTRAKGHHGFSRILFDNMHKQGFMMRQQEKHLLHHIIKADKNPDKTAAALHKVKNADQLKKMLDKLVDTEKETVGEYIKIEKLEMSSFDAYNLLLERFVEMICKAASVHELPARDSEQMQKLKTVIVSELEERVFENMRATVLRQLESYEEEAEKKMAA